MIFPSYRYNPWWACIAAGWSIIHPAAFCDQWGHCPACLCSTRLVHSDWEDAPLGDLLPNSGSRWPPVRSWGWQGPWEAGGWEGCSSLGRYWMSVELGLQGSTKGTGDWQAPTRPRDEFVTPVSSPGQQVSPEVPILQSHKLSSHKKIR